MTDYCYKITCPYCNKKSSEVISVGLANSTSSHYCSNCGRQFMVDISIQIIGRKPDDHEIEEVENESMGKD